MDWCIEKTTHNERTVINNALFGLFDNLEQAETLLYTVIEDCFNNREQEAVSKAEAEWVGAMLRIVQDILSDTIVAYHLTVADTENVRVKNYIAAADAVKTALQCERAFNGVYAFERSLTAEGRRPIMEARIKIGDMEDASAILAVDGLTGNGG